MKTASRSRRKALMMRTAASALALALIAGGAEAQEARRAFEIAPQPLADALLQFARQADIDIVAAADLTRGRTAPRVSGELTTAEAMNQLLAGSGLQAEAAGGGYVLARTDDPQSQGAAGDGADGTVEALIVTAQKREEDIQDVPIAMSAFTQEALTTHQIAGGPDLMTQIPNFTFTKTNFSSYSIQIRGIGTQAISATVDPAVAVAFNNTPFIRNRFFEQEFYDLNRIEVLRGPQGTLYGRNATAGVVNILSARPRDVFEARLSADVSNYNSTRLEGMLNIPLVEDKVALRLAGAWTKRDGYVTNEIDGEQIDGRDLWSVRATLGFEPNDRVRAWLTYEHFEEDDDRLRSGKQLCTKHESPTEFDGVPLPDTGGSIYDISAFTSQGCIMGSLYDDEAFQTPNGWALPYFGPLWAVGLPVDVSIEPYVSNTQSKDLRVIESTLTPVYQAKADILHLAFEADVTESLTLSSETAYSIDELFSFQDFNRFNTSPGIFDPNDGFDGFFLKTQLLDENGTFCDPQLGCADRLVAADVSTARSDQFSQELRLSSDFDGPLNFHLGANFLRYDTVDKYYVFINTLTLYSAMWGRYSETNPWTPNVSDNSDCLFTKVEVDPLNADVRGCLYIDPNPIGSLNDQGRNYFLSKNPFRLMSYAVFGELQYKLTPDLKLTAGVRYTVDRKHAPIIPSWLLTGGYGTPVRNIVDQEWREPTGRLVLDWKPDLTFTDETLIYASYAHGYKAGGTNPPLPGALPLAEAFDEDGAEINRIYEIQPPEFGPEFVDAFEIGAKNTMLDGRLTLNANVFYYDYEGYQISSIVNRSAINLNFDAEVWGAELEADWRPLENLRIGFKGGWEKTRIGEGQSAVDMIDRTAGMEGWAVIKPFPTNPSNCVFPEWLLGNYLSIANFSQPCTTAYIYGLDPVTFLPYVPNPTLRAGPNNTTQPLNLPGYPGFDPASVPSPFGFPKDLGGNELPNAPDFTTTLTVDYTLPLPNDWLMTLHGDFYRQSSAWTRIFNEDPYDKLKPFTQVNFAAIFTNEDAGWKVMAYVKNVLDKDNITGAFLNSDDTGLTTNVFLNEPRLYGLRVTKQWTGAGGWFTGGSHAAGQPFPLTVELGASTQRMGADAELYSPAFVDIFRNPPASIAGPVPAYPIEVQDEDLDWGDGREVRLTWRPGGTPWQVSLGARSGRANGHFQGQDRTQSPDSLFGPAQYQTHPFCNGPGDGSLPPNDPAGRSCVIPGPDRFSLVLVDDREEHTLVDFAVGREFGLGLDRPGAVSLGLRYAEFESTTHIDLDGTPDYQLPDAFTLAFPAHVTIYRGAMDAIREFEGVGPVLSWEAARKLFGNDDAGIIDLEWTVTGGMLFGKQETAVEHVESGSYYSFTWGFNGPGSPSGRGPKLTPPSYNAAFAEQRSERVQAPLVGVDLGLAYSVGRVKIGAGYRWERYYNVIDGGLDEHRDDDRTVDGPFMKLSVGFGG